MKRSTIALAFLIANALIFAAAPSAQEGQPSTDTASAEETTAAPATVPEAAPETAAPVTVPEAAPETAAPVTVPEASPPVTVPEASPPPVEESAIDSAAEARRLGRELEEANVIIDELRSQIWEIEERARAAEEEASAAAESAVDAEARALEVEARVASIEGELASAEERAAAAEEEASLAQENLVDAEARTAEAEAQAAVAEAQATSVEGQLALAEERFAAAADRASKTLELEAEVEAQRARVAELEADAQAQRTKAEALEAEAASLRETVRKLEAKIAELEIARNAIAERTGTEGALRLEHADYPELLHSGFGGVSRSMGTWTIEGGVASQIDPRQFFSRLSFPAVQARKPILYSFEVKTGPKGWVGAGLHFFADEVKKPRGYGEGKSLLLWLTRDEAARGGRETWLQLYRSDDDVNMQRVLDAAIQEGLSDWLRIDVAYDPAEEFAIIAVNGTVRAAYRAFFGIGSGVSVSLRTLGEGVSFRNFEIRQ